MTSYLNSNFIKGRYIVLTVHFSNSWFNMNQLGVIVVSILVLSGTSVISVVSFTEVPAVCLLVSSIFVSI